MSAQNPIPVAAVVVEHSDPGLRHLLGMASLANALKEQTGDDDFEITEAEFSDMVNEVVNHHINVVLGMILNITGMTYEGDSAWMKTFRESVVERTQQRISALVASAEDEANNPTKESPHD